MTYKVLYTELNNPSKQPIVVQDQSLNNQTSVTLVGQNYSGYAPIIASDLLHLLENFANPTAPTNPVQGQLWYDNVNNILRVWSGTVWNEAGSVKKASKSSLATGAPDIANSTIGDLWVDTDNSQLYLFSGSNWLLIGPQFSQGTLTGPIIENIADVNNLVHSVISNYASNASTKVSYRIAIISNDTFTPKIAIPGFDKIKSGINLVTSAGRVQDSGSPYTGIWGTASSADALLVGTSAVPAANFLRSDTTNTTRYPINIQNPSGISIGGDLSFSIQTNTNSTVMYSKNSGSAINFNLNNAGVSNTVLYLDATGKIGIGLNKTFPTSTLDVAGTITSTGLIINTAGTVPSASLTVDTVGGTLSTSLLSSFGDDITTYGQNYLNYLDTNGNPVSASVIIPGKNINDTTASGIYDIGSPVQTFRNIYANNFVGKFSGDITGNLSGSVNGSAAKLASPTQFYLSGDVNSNIISFDGESSTGIANFITSIDPNFISNKKPATDSSDGDEFLVNRSGSLQRMTKKTLFNHVATLPIGTILPFAGTVVPTGYLLCDGSEVDLSYYSSLFNVIGYTYKTPVLLKGSSTFALPDLRGRFPLGADNMNNNLTMPESANPNNKISAGGGSANRVTDITAKTLASGSGQQSVTLSINNIPDHKHSLNTGNTQYYAVGIPNPAVTDASASNGFGLQQSGASGQGQGLSNSAGVISSTTGQPITIMNPYQTINYIIFHGVL